MYISLMRSDVYLVTLDSKQALSIKGVSFTAREVDLLACILSVKPFKLIASILDLSPKTVETHSRNILKKQAVLTEELLLVF